MSSKKQYYIHLGFSTILTLFMAICLMVFAALSILTSRSDLNLSKKYGDRIHAEYAADTSAKAFTQKIESTVISVYQSHTASLADCLGPLNALTPPTDITDFQVQSDDTDTLTVSFAVPVTAHQQLNAVLLVSYPKNGTDKFFQIARWQITNLPTTETTDTYLPLYEGQ